MDNISIYSLNCEGVKRNIENIRDILKCTSCDILWLQETWLLDCELNVLADINQKYLFTGISGVDLNKSILMSVYLPCDNYSNVPHPEYVDCIDYLEQLYTS